MNDGPITQSVSLGLRFLCGLLALGCLGWLGSGIHQIETGSRGVLVRCGRVISEHGPGLLIAWPRPVEQLILVPAAETPLTLEVKRFALPTATIQDGDTSGAMLTGDAGIVHLMATVVYTVAEPRLYAFASERLPAALDRLAAASLVEACARRSLDGVMVARMEQTAAGQTTTDSATAREALRGELITTIDRGARELGLGIAISRVDLITALPNRAQTAFIQVAGAESESAATIATARTAAARTTQEAAVVAARTQDDATAHAHELIAQAQVTTAAIAAVISPSDPAQRALLFTRLYHERLATILRHAGTITVIAPDSAPLAIPSP